MSKQIEVIKKGLLSPPALGMFRDALPNATGKHAEEAAKRFAKMAYTAICQSRDLQQCSVASIIRAASISASLNLDIDARGLAYLVPYRNKKSGQLEAQFQIGYLGLVELAYRSGRVKAMSAHCVYESEREQVKIVRENGRYRVEHPFSYSRPTGELIAAYATAEIEGLGAQTIVLRADEIDHYRKLSQAPDSPAWKNHFEAMAKKTAIRQLAKFLPKSVMSDFARGAAIDERESFVEAQQSAKEEIEAQAGKQFIDLNFQPPEDENDKPDEPETLNPEWEAKKQAALKKLQEAQAEAEQYTSDKPEAAENGQACDEEMPEFMRDDV